MKLNRHRKDVRLLRDSWASHGGSSVFVDIARRYQRLILCFEQQFNRSGNITEADVDEYGGPWLRKVLEDAKK